MPSSGLYSSGILTKVHRQYYLRDTVVYNSSVVKIIFYAKMLFSWVFLCFLLAFQSFGVLFRVCVGLVPCVPWFEMFYHRTWV